MSRTPQPAGNQAGAEGERPGASSGEAAPRCGEVYHLALAEQRPIYCEEPADHAGEHRASEPDGDVWWGRHRA